MKWFKHHSNCMISSNSFAALKREFGWQGVGRYWALIELLAEKFEGDSTTFELDCGLIQQRLDIYHAKKMRMFLESLSNLFSMSVDIEGNLCTIKYPKLLEIYHKDSVASKNRRALGGPKSGLDKDRDKDKDKDKELVLPEVADTQQFRPVIPTEDKYILDLIKPVSTKVQNNWLKLYPVEFICRELINADSWLASNPRKRPKSKKGWSTFLTGWLSRGYEWQRKRANGSNSFSQKREEKHTTMAEKVMKGEL